MAQYAYTFTSGDVVTPTKLNNARTVSEIVNADINNNAAIAGTKIAPDFGSQNLVTTASVATFQSGSTDGAVVSSLNSNNNGLWTWVGNASGGGAHIGKQVSSSSPPTLTLYKSRGGNTATPTVVSSGDGVGTISFKAHDGTGWIDAAAIGCGVDGTPGTNDMPGRLVFSTTADGASSVTERMRITAAGNVGIANTAPTEKLHVTGNIKASGFIDADTSFRGQASDSAAAPSFTWTGDTNTGMFRPAADTLAFCEGGVEAMRISDNGSILIGTTTPIDPAQGSDDGATFWQGISLRISSTGNCILLRKRSTNGNIMSFSRDTTTVGTISVTTTATAYNTSSDYRLKENPTPLIGGLATINQLQPCEFTWKSDGSVGRGFIAHELQAVVPEAVTGEKDAIDAEGNPQYQGVDLSKLVPYLVSAVQELKARVEALEAA